VTGAARGGAARGHAGVPEGSIVRRTLLALLEPKRLVPTLLVAGALVTAQASFSRHDPFAVPLGVVMCLAFVLVAPVSWRVLFPEGLDLGHGGVRLVLFGAIGAGVVLALGVVVPRALGMGRTLLTAPSSVLVSAALFLVGGWGLGRDIDMAARLDHAERRAQALAREAERAQLLALRAHLDPHFLFNTLNAIAEWCREDGEVAERAVLRLSAMLRAVLAGVKAPAWPLADELDLVDTLFELHRLRDPELFRFDRRVPSPPPAVAVPPLLLLPLAENAMKHGPGAGHRGDVTLSVAVDAGAERLVVTIANAGPFAGRRAGGEGLPTVEKRLRLAYDGDAAFTIGAAGGRTVAELSLPLGGPRGETPA
jgi:hypothetical protein